MTFTQVGRQVITLAEAVNAARAVRANNRPMVESIADPLDYGPPLPEENALREFLFSKTVATVYMLTAVVYLGRRDFDASESWTATS